MDWNLKAPSWDLTEFEQAAISNIHGVQGSSSLGENKIRGGFSIDLKLGRVGNFTEELVDKWKEPPGVAKMANLASSGSSKRARAAGNGNQIASCLVDGCNSDLSNCREYHRRHKVCEQHSKTPQVTINGHKQRFCQQCSRFHSLEEFDEGKRSCRKRLDGHNRRRRKPQPEPMSRTGSFLSNYQGTQLLPFSNTQIYPSTTVMNPTWTGAVSACEDARLYNQHQQFNLLDKQSSFLGSSSSSYKVGKQFTPLQGDNLTLNNQPSSKTSICQPLLMSIALPESGGGSGGHNMFCDRLTNTVRYGDCALSLLSSPQSQTSGISLSHLVHPNSTPMAMVQPLGPNLHDHRLDPMDSVLVSSGRDADIHYAGSFHLGSDESPGNNVSQTLPFHWE